MNNTKLEQSGEMSENALAVSASFSLLCPQTISMFCVRPGEASVKVGVPNKEVAKRILQMPAKIGQLWNLPRGIHQNLQSRR